QVRILAPFTSDATALEKAIRLTQPNGSTSLYNAIYISLKELKKAKAKSAEDIRRQAIVVLSDGDDTSSLIEYDEVLDLAKRSETAIYAIGLRQGETGRREFQEAEFVLRQLSQETGGRAFFPTEARQLPAIYQAIADELSSQYSLAYSSGNPRRDGAWRRIVVKVNRPASVARTKLGYYGPASAFGWLLGLSYLSVELTTAERAMGVFVSAILAGLAVLPAFSPDLEPRPPLLQSPLFTIHVLTMLFAYASFALAFVLGVTYVLLFKEIKAKQLGFFYARLPSLQTLDVMNGRAITVGWIFLTVGVAVGGIWATQIHPSPGP